MISKFLLSYLPQVVKTALSSKQPFQLRKFLEEFLFSQADSTATRILNAKKVTDKLRKYPDGAKDVLANYILNSVLGKINPIALGTKENLIVDILSNLQLNVNRNRDQVQNYEDSLLYKISKLNMFNRSFSISKIVDKINTNLGENNFNKYTKEIFYTIREKNENNKFQSVQKRAYLNSLTFLYLAEGELSLREYLKSEGFNQLYVRNRIVNYVKNNATKHRKDYSFALKKVRKLRKLQQEVSDIYSDFKIDRNF